jgi:hypothetical protein
MPATTSPTPDPVVEPVEHEGQLRRVVGHSTAASATRRRRPRASSGKAVMLASPAPSRSRRKTDPHRRASATRGEGRSRHAWLLALVIAADHEDRDRPGVLAGHAGPPRPDRVLQLFRVWESVLQLPQRCLVCRCRSRRAMDDHRYRIGAGACPCCPCEALQGSAWSGEEDGRSRGRLVPAGPGQERPLLRARRSFSKLFRGPLRR